MSKVLVTGATGFVGSHLMNALLQTNTQVVALVRPETDVRDHANLEIHRGNLLDPSSLRDCCQNVEAVYHLAANPSLGTRDARALSVNWEGTRNLLHEARSANTVKRFVLMSSLAAAGSRPGDRLSELSTETDTATPDTAYGKSKL